MKIISLILARGGSRELKIKISRTFTAGLLFPIQLTLQKSKVDETWVSTDDKKIKSISLKNDALVIDRPAELATDTSPSEDSLIHFTENVNFDILVFLQPTSPLLKHTDINNALELMNKYDSILVDIGTTGCQDGTKISKQLTGTLQKRPRRQDVFPEYVENGALHYKKGFAFKV